MLKLIRILFVALAISPLTVLASENHGAQEKETVEKTEAEKRAEYSEDVKHHTKDSHDFHIFSDKSEGAHYGFPLPVILWTDNGLVTFMSSAFHHDDAGKHIVEKNGMKFTKLHGKIYQLNEGETELKLNHETHHAENAKAIILDFSITKNVFSSIIIALLLIWVFRSVAKAYRSDLAPSGAAKFFEPLVLFVRDEIAKPNIGEKDHRKYMGYLLTVFFFIWFLNLFGMTPLGVNVTGNIAVTFGLAILTFIITQTTAKRDYWLHIFWMPGVPYPMRIILAPIELLGVFIKPFALMIRLYANMLAGHIVLGSLLSLLFIFDNWFARGSFLGLTLFLNLIELLVAFLQAYIFTMLTALYFGAAAAEHAEHH